MLEWWSTVRLSRVYPCIGRIVGTAQREITVIIWAELRHYLQLLGGTDAPDRAILEVSEIACRATLPLQRTTIPFGPAVTGMSGPRLE